MYKFLFNSFLEAYKQQIPATGAGLFRLFFGLITFQETLFLLYFNHLIFDPIPYLDVEFPMIYFFTCLWALVALSVAVGYRCQQSLLANYIFWIVFVHFTPMQRDFDGGFDLFMIGANFFLLFMPVDKALAIDGLRRKLVNPFKDYRQYQSEQVSYLSYYLPVIVCLGFLYFDSAVHKLFAEHWRNGLGGWLPSSMPYYVSALDLSWMLNLEALQKAIGYIIIVFQFTFLLFFRHRYLKFVYIAVGAGLHFGIAISFNIYPFGMGMLVFYILLLPPQWYQKIASRLQVEQPRLQVFYDEQCPLCNKTVLTLNHFDIFSAVEFKGAQSYARDYPALNNYTDQQLMQDLYAVDSQGRVYEGVATYAQILIAMRYCAIIGYLMKMPGIFNSAQKVYRKIADNRGRVSCDASCVVAEKQLPAMFYDRFFTQTDAKQIKRYTHRITKVFCLLFLLQLNSTLHYGVFYRLQENDVQYPSSKLLSSISNSVILTTQSFIGITPHALYMHDHFEGYHHLIALTYLDSSGNEQWLPFVNEQGRLLAPNWGRVHSMWANIAVTPNIDHWRLEKFIAKVTAFWGIKSGLKLDETRFLVKMKKIQSPSQWRPNLLRDNFSGPWATIGSVQWAGKFVEIDLPENINNL